MKNRLWLVFACVMAFGTTGSAQTPLDQTKAQLTKCQALVGEKEMLIDEFRTQVENGAVVDARQFRAQLLKDLIAKVEKESPAYTFDPITGKIEPKKAVEAGKGGQ